MKNLLTIGALCIAATPSFAAPYCDALLNKAQLEKRYQRLAPIHNDDQTGWIFTADQLNTDYEMSSEVMMLMTGIIEAIEKHDISVAILTAPPRPVVAGQEIVDATMGVTGGFDVDGTKASFTTLIAQLRDAGAVVPDLLPIATTSQTDHPYYFQRDTHWTTTGAAQSAIALGVELGRPAGFAMDQLQQLELYEERGSLSDIVDATCGMRDAPETMPIYDYTRINSGGLGLLDDTTSTRTQVTLLGTSFSNRYRRDQYQAADAIAAALTADVENLSVSGGGLIGPLEEYVLSGDLQSGRRELLIWEFPYTEGLNISPLRQLLGALMAPRAIEMVSQNGSLVDNGAAFELPIAAFDADLLHITLDTDQALRVTLDLTFENGTTKTVKLRRKSAMQEISQHADWYVYIGGYKYGDVTSIALRIDPKANATSAEVSYLGTATN